MLLVVDQQEGDRTGIEVCLILELTLWIIKLD